MAVDDDAVSGEVPDSLAGVPGYADLFFPAEERSDEHAVYVPVLSDARREILEANLEALGVAAGRAALSTGDALRELATVVGVHGPDRISLLEVSPFGMPDLLGRIVLADARVVVDLTVDTAPSPVWRTAATLFEIIDRRLRMRGDRDQGIVFDLDRRVCATRTIVAVFTDDGEPVGQLGRWSTGLRSTIWNDQAYVCPMITGQALAAVTERIEALMRRYGVRFVQWPDATPGT